MLLFLFVDSIMNNSVFLNTHWTFDDTWDRTVVCHIKNTFIKEGVYQMCLEHFFSFGCCLFIWCWLTGRSSRWHSLPYLPYFYPMLNMRLFVNVFVRARFCFFIVIAGADADCCCCCCRIGFELLWKSIQPLLFLVFITLMQSVIGGDNFCGEKLWYTIYPMSVFQSGSVVNRELQYTHTHTQKHGKMQRTSNKYNEMER